MRARSVLLSLLLALPALAENAERGQRDAEEQVVPKLNLLCGGRFTVKYDLASLKQHNQDIRYDQTGGSLECDEPLRLLWTLCQSDAGKATVRKAELREVQCRGTAAREGTLTVKNGVIVVERAFEEPQPFVRAKRQLEQALGVKVALAEADPYRDDAWRDFRMAPAPVTSTTDYCLVNGNKEKLDLYAADRLRGDGTVKCWKGGAVVIALVVKGRKKTGLWRNERDDWFVVEHLVDDRRDGLSEEVKAGVRTSQSLWKAGERVWTKDFTATGQLKQYSRQYEKGLASLHLFDDGRVNGLSCLPEVRDDEVLAPWCGFRGEKTVSIIDGTDKVLAVLTFRDGRLVREAPGNSRYGTRRAVSYVDGKKDGEERLLREDGTLERTVQWRLGVQDGPEQTYSKDGKKVVLRSTWKAGDKTEETEFFLNGNPKRTEVYAADKSMTRTAFYDLGAKQSEARFVRCSQSYRGWCEDGVSRQWFESGGLAEQSTWKAGKREGEAKTWFLDGGPCTDDAWVNDTLRRRRAWDEHGTLTTDEAYEEDGSRMLKR